MHDPKQSKQLKCVTKNSGSVHGIFIELQTSPVFAKKKKKFTKLIFNLNFIIKNCSVPEWHVIKQLINLFF